MLIAIVDFSVAADSRPAAIGILQAHGRTIRSMDGNLAFGAYCDANDAQAVRIWHEWNDATSFRAYTASEPFAQLGLGLRPLMVAPPVSRRMLAEQLETLAG